MKKQMFRYLIAALLVIGLLIFKAGATPQSSQMAINAIRGSGGTLSLPVGTYNITSNYTIPANIILKPEPGAILSIAPGVTLTINGPFESGLYQVFSCTGTGLVTFGPRAVKEIYPEWWGAESYVSIAAALAGVDSNAAIQAAIVAGSTAGIPIKITRAYLFSNLIVYPGTHLHGDNWITSSLVSKPGSSGYAIWDRDTSSQKVQLDNFAVYCNGQNYTAGIRLGYSKGGPMFGDSANLQWIWVRDVPKGWCFNISGNAAFYLGIITTGINQNGIRLTGGGGNKGCIFQVYGCSGTALDVSYADIYGIHFEANSKVQAYLRRNCSLNGVDVSLANGFAADHLFGIDSGCSRWTIGNVHYYYGGTTATVSGGNILTAFGTYTGGNATTANSGASVIEDGQGTWTNIDQGLKKQAFVFQVRNNAGTLQHRIIDQGYIGTLPLLSDRINNASATWTNTPTGTDATTPMASGAKIGSASPSLVFLDTAQQSYGYGGVFQGVIEINTTGTLYGLLVSISGGTNINSVTRSRLTFQLINPTTGAGVSWNTTTIPAGDYISIKFFGWVN